MDIPAKMNSPVEKVQSHAFPSQATGPCPNESVQTLLSGGVLPSGEVGKY